MHKDDGKKFEMKTMSPEELNYAIDWAADEGWNPGLFDADSFYKADSKGFFIGELWGRPIGCISAVKYGKNYGFIGLFIVEEEFRKQWFGTYIARTALSYLGKRNIGLDGFPDRLETFKRIGFKFAYNINRYEFIGKGNISKDYVDANDVDFKELLKYDTKMFSEARPEFLKSWITQPESGSLCSVQDKKINGFGVIRKCSDGFKIGPLFADNEKIAENLLNNLSGFAPNERIYIDIPEVNKAGIALAKKYRMKMTFEYIRMYSIKQPDYPVKNVYGVTSFELG